MKSNGAYARGRLAASFALNFQRTFYIADAAKAVLKTFGGSRFLAIGKPKAKTELRTDAGAPIAGACLRNRFRSKGNIK